MICGQKLSRKQRLETLTQVLCLYWTSSVANGLRSPRHQPSCHHEMTSPPANSPPSKVFSLPTMHLINVTLNQRLCVMGIRSDHSEKKGFCLFCFSRTLRPGSDAELFMSQTQFKFGPTQIIFAKYIITTYAFGSAHEKYSVWIKAELGSAQSYFIGSFGSRWLIKEAFLRISQFCIWQKGRWWSYTTLEGGGLKSRRRCSPPSTWKVWTAIGGTSYSGWGTACRQTQAESGLMRA